MAIYTLSKNPFLYVDIFLGYLTCCLCVDILPAVCVWISYLLSVCRYIICCLCVDILPAVCV